MKKIISIFTVITVVLCMSGCVKKVNTYVGVNAEILEINSNENAFIVKGLDDDSMLGEKCYVKCDKDGLYYIYVNNETEEILDLKFEDFIVGDEITLDIENADNSFTQPIRIQLLTQRK